MRRDVGCGVRIAGAVELVEGIELRLDSVVATECTFEIGCVRFVDRFVIPTCAFGIEFVEMFLIRFACPFKGSRELRLFDLVIVVDELASLGNSVGVIRCW